MPLWIGLVIAAQFIYAIVSLIDRYIIASNTIPRPLAYAFYVSLLSALAVFVFFLGWLPLPFLPFSLPVLANVSMPSLLVLANAGVAGIAFFMALVALFSAFRDSSASDVVPVSGAASAVGTLVLSWLLYGATLSANFTGGFVLLVVGTALLSHYRFAWRTAAIALLAGLFFALHFVTIDALFEITHFDNAFFWSRVGIATVALGLLVVPRLRNSLFADCSRCSASRGGMLIIGNKLLAGVASILTLKAIDLGDVSIVKALDGLKFAFLLGISAVIGPMLPYACGEAAPRRQLVYKSVAVGLILAGFFVLFL